MSGAVPSCIVATHNDECRERMEKLMMQDPEGADRVVRTETRINDALAVHIEEHDERAKTIAKHDHHKGSSGKNQESSSSSSGVVRSPEEQHRDSQDDAKVNEGDHGQIGGKIDSESMISKKAASVATSQPKPELMNTERFWDHDKGGELDACEVPKARQLEVDYLNKMRVFERVPYEVAKAMMRREPIKVRWVDTLKGSGIHRSRLVAKEFRRGSKYEGFVNFSATPPLELVKLIISLVAKIAMMHTDISRAYFHVPSKEEKYVQLPSEMWRSEYPEYGRLRVCHSTGRCGKL